MSLADDALAVGGGGALLHDDDFTIIAKYQSEYAGRVQYYLLAQDAFRLGRLHWVMETSLLKTLAGKHRSTVGKMAGKYKTVIDTPAGPRKCLQLVIERDRGRKPLVARFGGYPSGECARPPSPTSDPSWPAPSGTSWSTGSSPGAANSARARRALRSTTSASSLLIRKPADGQPLLASQLDTAVADWKAMADGGLVGALEIRRYDFPPLDYEVIFDSAFMILGLYDPSKANSNGTYVRSPFVIDSRSLTGAEMISEYSGRFDCLFAWCREAAPGRKGRPAAGQSRSPQSARSKTAPNSAASP